MSSRSTMSQDQIPQPQSPTPSLGACGGADLQSDATPTPFTADTQEQTIPKTPMHLDKEFTRHQNRGKAIPNCGNPFATHMECPSDCKKFMFDAVLAYDESDCKIAYEIQTWMQNKLQLQYNGKVYKPRIELLHNLHSAPFIKAVAELNQFTNICIPIFTANSAQKGRFTEGNYAVWSTRAENDSDIIPLLYGFDENDELPADFTLKNTNYLRYEKKEPHFKDAMQKRLSKHLGSRLQHDNIRRKCEERVGRLAISANDKPTQNESEDKRETRSERKPKTPLCVSSSKQDAPSCKSYQAAAHCGLHLTQNGEHRQQDLPQSPVTQNTLLSSLPSQVQPDALAALSMLGITPEKRLSRVDKTDQQASTSENATCSAEQEPFQSTNGLDATQSVPAEDVAASKIEKEKGCLQKEKQEMSPSEKSVTVEEQTKETTGLLSKEIRTITPAQKPNTTGSQPHSQIPDHCPAPKDNQNAGAIQRHSQNTSQGPQADQHQNLAFNESRSKKCDLNQTLTQNQNAHASQPGSENNDCSPKITPNPNVHAAEVRSQNPDQGPQSAPNQDLQTEQSHSQNIDQSVKTAHNLNLQATKSQLQISEKNEACSINNNKTSVGNVTSNQADSLSREVSLVAAKNPQAAKQIPQHTQNKQSQRSNQQETEASGHLSQTTGRKTQKSDQSSLVTIGQMKTIFHQDSHDGNSMIPSSASSSTETVSSGTNTNVTKLKEHQTCYETKLTPIPTVRENARQVGSGQEVRTPERRATETTNRGGNSTVQEKVQSTGDIATDSETCVGYPNAVSIPTSTKDEQTSVKGFLVPPQGDVLRQCAESQGSRSDVPSSVTDKYTKDSGLGSTLSSQETVRSPVYDNYGGQQDSCLHDKFLPLTLQKSASFDTGVSEPVFSQPSSDHAEKNKYPIQETQEDVKGTKDAEVSYNDTHVPGQLFQDLKFMDDSTSNSSTAECNRSEELEKIQPTAKNQSQNEETQRTEGPTREPECSVSISSARHQHEVNADNFAFKTAGAVVLGPCTINNTTIMSPGATAPAPGSPERPTQPPAPSVPARAEDTGKATQRKMLRRSRDGDSDLNADGGEAIPDNIRKTSIGRSPFRGLLCCGSSKKKTGAKREKKKGKR